MSPAAAPQPKRIPGQLPVGDTKALEEDALRLSAAMYRLAARLLGDAQEAEDVLQDAFARVLEQLRRGAFRGDCTLSTWLYRVVTNVALNRQRGARAHAAHRELSPSGEPTSAMSPEAAVALRELAEAMSELPDDQRAALVLKEIEGLPSREVAEVMERSEGAVEQLLVRGRQALRRRFEP